MWNYSILILVPDPPRKLVFILVALDRLLGDPTARHDGYMWGGAASTRSESPGATSA